MNVFDLAATISLDTSKYDNALEDAGKQASVFGDVFKANIASSAVQKGFSMLASGVKSVVSGIAGLTKQSLEAYGNYEQLTGGVQKLYGNMGMSLDEYAKSVGKSTEEVKGEWEGLEKAQNLVLKNAEDAYKTSGMSMNEYMETATSFSAALINSLGGDTVEAAKQTDVAMRAISDNVNTFGTDMESVSNAFQGFAKENYTMLDNLKLGYGGTKDGMQQLIDDANAYAEATGQASGLTIDSFSDIVTAIDLVQQKQNIAGTTAAEASTTIQGSLQMLKSAWDNLMTGLGDGDANISQLVDNVISSAEQVLENVGPIIEQILPAIGEAIPKIATFLAEKLPGMATTLIPPIIEGAITIGGAIISALPEIVSSIWETVKSLFTEQMNGFGIDVSGIFTGIEDVVNSFVGFASAVGDAIGQVVEKLFGIESGAEGAQSAIDGVSGVLDVVSGVFDALAQNADKVVPILAAVLGGFLAFKVVSGILGAVAAAQKALNVVMSMNPIVLIVTLIATLVTALITLWNTNEDFRNAVKGIWDAITGFFKAAWEKIKEVWSVVADFFKNVWEGIKSVFSAVGDFFKNAFTKARDGVKAVWKGIKGFFSNVWSGIKGVFSTVGGWFKDKFQKAKDNAQQAWSNAKTVFGKVWDNIKGAFSNTGSWFKEKFQNAKENAQNAWSNARTVFGKVWNNVKDAFSNAGSWFKEKFSNAKDSAHSGFQGLKDKMKTVWENTKTVYSAVGTWFSNKFSDAKNAIGRVWEGIKSKLTAPFEAAKNTIKGIVDRIKSFFNFKIKTPTVSVPTTSSSPVKHAKAMNQPYLFSKETFFSAGEVGDEMLYGRKSLMNDIKQAVGGSVGSNVVMNVTVNGADNPEDWANRFMRQAQLKARTA